MGYEYCWLKVRQEGIALRLGLLFSNQHFHCIILYGLLIISPLLKFHDDLEKLCPAGERRSGLDLAKLMAIQCI